RRRGGVSERPRRRGLSTAHALEWLRRLPSTPRRRELRPRSTRRRRLLARSARGRKRKNWPSAPSPDDLIENDIHFQSPVEKFFNTAKLLPIHFQAPWDAHQEPSQYQMAPIPRERIHGRESPSGASPHTAMRICGAGSSPWLASMPVTSTDT